MKDMAVGCARGSDQPRTHKRSGNVTGVNLPRGRRTGCADKRLPKRPQTVTFLGQPAQAFAAPPVQLQRAALISTTVQADMFTMRRTVAAEVRMWIGAATPSSTGPMAMPLPAAVLSRL